MDKINKLNNLLCELSHELSCTKHKLQQQQQIAGMTERNIQFLHKKLNHIVDQKKHIQAAIENQAEGKQQQ